MENQNEVMPASLVDVHVKGEAITNHIMGMDMDSSDQDREENFTVEKILKRRVNKNGQLSYLIKWQGYPNEENTWELISDLDCWDMISMFEQSRRSEIAAKRTKKTSPEETIPAVSIKMEQDFPVPSTPPKSKDCDEGSLQADVTYASNKTERRRSSRKITLATQTPVIKSEPDLVKREADFVGTPIKIKENAGRGSRKPRKPVQLKRKVLPEKSNAKKALNFNMGGNFLRKDPEGARLALEDMARKNITNLLTKGKEPVSIVGLMRDSSGRIDHLVMFEKEILEPIPTPYMRQGYPQLLIDYYERKMALLER